MEVKLLNAFMLQLNTIIQLLALFKLILYSNLLTIINVELYFTFDSILFLKKKKKKIKSRPTDPISNHKVTGNEHFFVWPYIVCKFLLTNKNKMCWSHCFISCKLFNSSTV